MATSRADGVSRRCSEWLYGRQFKKASCQVRRTSSAHFSRGDLSTLRDFAKLKRRFSAVRRTYATTIKPLVLRILTDQGTTCVSVRLVDTMLIAPAGASLASLGATLGVPKVDLPHGHSKARMDVFKQQKPEEFARYALADAEIAARWAAALFRWYRMKWACREPFPHSAVSASR